jgi:c-di-GMP-binding flagellar brake protein YcgR
MKIANRRESPRINITLRCPITAPSLWAQRLIHTYDISRSGVLVVWRDENVAGHPAVGQLLTVAREAMQPVTSSWMA